MCDNTANNHFSNVASTYAAIYHQLYYNINESQIPGSLNGNHHSSLGADHMITQPAYNHLQPPTAEPLSFQHHAVSFTNSVNNPVVSVHHMDRSIPLKKQQIQLDNDAAKFVFTTLNETGHVSNASFENEEAIPIFFNSPGSVMNMKRRSCEKEDQFREIPDLNRVKGKESIMLENDTLRNYEEWLKNKPADMSTKSLLTNAESFELGGRRPKKSKPKKRPKEVQVTEKPKYLPSGQINLSKSKAHKYDKLYEIKECYYNSCHVCFNEPHINTPGCPLMTPVATVKNHDNHPFGLGMPEQLLLGLSRVYKDQESVFARDPIAAYTRFGPLKGKKLQLQDLSKMALLEIDLKHFWPLNASENDELDLESFIDTQKPSESNWMRFLKPELPVKDSFQFNIQRVTLDEEIYFITTKDIVPGEELLFRAIEPPFRVYYNLSHLPKISTICHSYPCKKKKESSFIEFENLVYLVRHTYLNHPCRPGVFKLASVFNCNLCKEDLFDLTNYQNHMKEKHGIEKQVESLFTCYLCKVSFSSRQVLRKHMNTEHPVNSKHESMDCTICGKIIPDKYKLRWHMKTIHLSEPVSCNVCGKSFKSKPVMENHIKKVHEQKYWKECSHCGKGFKDMYQLRQHMLTHTGLKPFHCIIKGCPAQFTTKQWLQKHYIGGHGFTKENMPNIQRAVPENTQPMATVFFKPKPKKKATYVPPAKPGTSLRIPADFNLKTALRPTTFSLQKFNTKTQEASKLLVKNTAKPKNVLTMDSTDAMQPVTDQPQAIIETDILPQVSLGQEMLTS